MCARRPNTLALLALTGVVALAPRNGAGAEASPPTFPSSTEVVVLDVIARDGRGRPVHDLQPNELQVTEDGQACEIRSVRLVQTPLTGPSLTGPRRAASTTSSPSSQATPSAAQPSRPPVVVLLFDQLDADSSRRAARAASEWLDQPIPVGTLFSVYQLGASLKQLQPLTADRTVLATSLRDRLARAGARRDTPVGQVQEVGSGDRGSAASGGGPTTSTERAFRTLAAGPKGSQDREPGEVDGAVLYFWDRAHREDRGRAAICALRAVVDALAMVEGRKSVLFFSEGIHTPGEMERDWLEDTISAANRANVAVYAIDARGLTIERAERDREAGLDAASAGAAGSIPGLMSDVLLAGPQANLRVVASLTGGLATTNTDRLVAALGHVTDDISSYYEVVYVPPRPAPDGRFHRTAVKVSRPHVSVRTRGGYVANGHTASVAATEWTLLEALALPPQPAAAAALPYRTSVLLFGRRGPERETVVLVDVPLSGVRLAVDPQTKRYRGRLSALVLIKSASGRPVSRMSHDWPFDGPEEEAERRKAGRNLFRQSLGLAPGRYVLQAVVRDEEAGLANTSSTEFEVQAADEALTSSSLVLVRRTQTAAAENAADPLRMGRVDVVPIVGPLRVEASDEPGIGYFVRAYLPPSADAPAATLEIRQNGELKAHATPKLGPPDGEGRIAYLGRLPVDRLPAGSYELELTMRSGASAATSRALFEIAGRPVAAPAPPPAIAGAVVQATESASHTSPPPSPPLPKPADPELANLLERAGRYVTDYADRFRNVVAEEDYRQVVTPRYQGGRSSSLQTGDLERAARRRTRADLVFVTLPGVFSWATFRDVFEVDGVPVRDRDARLEKLFRTDPAGAADRARQIVQESARYNLGPIKRTLNIPTLPLLFLDPTNQARFAFRKVGQGRNTGLVAVEVQYEEVVRPSLFHDPGSQGHDLPVEGRLWIDPTHGIVLRTVMRLHFAERRGGTGGRGEGTIITQYRHDSALQLWVPSEMQESYSAGTDTSAVARYSNYRQFTVTTDEQAKLPEPPQ
jgi:VWFA-related protein